MRNKSDLQEDLYNFGYISRDPQEDDKKEKKRLKRQRKRIRSLISIIILLVGGIIIYFTFFQHRQAGVGLNPMSSINLNGAMNSLDMNSMLDGTASEEQFVENATGIDHGTLTNITNKVRTTLGI